MRNHKKLYVAGAALATLAVIIFLLCDREQYLILSNAGTGNVVYYQEVRDGMEFAVSFTHSVNKSPVTEYYQIRDGKIYLTALRYESFGAGMPTEPEEEQVIRYEGDAMIIEGFERHIPYLCYFIGRSAGHTLIADEEIAFTELDKPGEPLLFTVTKWSRLLAFGGSPPDRKSIEGE